MISLLFIIHWREGALRFTPCRWIITFPAVGRPVKTSPSTISFPEDSVIEERIVSEERWGETVGIVIILLFQKALNFPLKTVCY